MWERQGMKMKKKIIYHLIGLMLMVVLLSGCGIRGGGEEVREPVGTTSQDTALAGASAEKRPSQDSEASDKATPKPQEDYLKKDPMDELLGDPYGNHLKKGGEIALVIDGSLMDGGYNEALYRGTAMYALGAGVSFSCYKVDGDMPEDFQKAIRNAIEDKGRLIVCAGYNFQEAVGALQGEYPEISFLLIDGKPLDDKGEPVKIKDNVHCAVFREEEAGYEAGYLAVMEGYRKLGFVGGEKVPFVIRYGHGYLQGIDAAAQDMGLTDVTVNYWYAGTFEPNKEIREQAAGWYEDGTEIIFACGGALYESVLEAADEQDGMMIGVDVDQSDVSERILTSAIKDIRNAVISSLDDYYASGGHWSEEFAGQERYFGAENNSMGIPVYGTTWRFRNVTADDFYKVFAGLKKDGVVVSDEIDEQPQVSVAVKNF